MWPLGRPKAAKSGNISLVAFLLLLSALSRSRANILCHAAALVVNYALQAAMLFAEPELPPDHRTATLYEVLAVGVFVDHELNNPLI